MNYDLVKLPEGVKPSQKGGIIKDLLGKSGVTSRSLNVSVSGPDVIVRFIDLPKMTKEQLNNALVFEAEKYIPFNVNEVVLDSIILGEGTDPGQIKVLLAAAKREPVEDLAKTVDGIGYDINCIDIDTFAMFNAYSNSYGTTDSESNAFVLFGHSTTDILIASGQTPSFMRQIQIAGSDITGAISKGLGVSAEEADGLKKVSSGEEAEKAMISATQVLDDLVREMQLSFGYFENRYNRNIKNVYLSGGQVYQGGIVGVLSEKLGMELSLWDPLKNIRIAEGVDTSKLGGISSMFSVSAGLALRS
jgi:type IV pilus assembly protein PilM